MTYDRRMKYYSVYTIVTTVTLLLYIIYWHINHLYRCTYHFQNKNNNKNKNYNLKIVKKVFQIYKRKFSKRKLIFELLWLFRPTKELTEWAKVILNFYLKKIWLNSTRSFDEKRIELLFIMTSSKWHLTRNYMYACRTYISSTI